MNHVAAFNSTDCPKSLVIGIAGFASVLMSGAMVGGVFAASAFFPVLTPITALAIGIIMASTTFATSATGSLLHMNSFPMASKVVAAVVGCSLLAIGIAVMYALGVPFSAVALLAACGFGSLILLGAVLATSCVMIPLVTCCAKSSCN